MWPKILVSMEDPETYKYHLRDRAGLAPLGRRGQNPFPMLQRVKICLTPIHTQYAVDVAQNLCIDGGSGGLQIPPTRPRRPRSARPARPFGRNPTRQLSLGAARRFAPGCAREKLEIRSESFIEIGRVLNDLRPKP